MLIIDFILGEEASALCTFHLPPLIDYQSGMRIWQVNLVRFTLK